MTLVSKLLHHYFANRYDVRAELQNTSPDLLNAFGSADSQLGDNRAIVEKAPETLTNAERDLLSRIEYMLLSSMTHLDERARNRHAVGVFLNFAFDDEDSRQFFLDHLMREQLRKVVYGLMSTLRNLQKVQYSWQFGGPRKGFLVLMLDAGPLSRSFTVEYDIPETEGTLAKDLPVLRELVDKASADLKGIVKEPSNWPTAAAVKDEATKARETAERMFSDLTSDELTLFGRHPGALRDAFLQALERLEGAPEATGEELVKSFESFINSANKLEIKSGYRTVEENSAIKAGTAGNAELMAQQA